MHRLAPLALAAAVLAAAAPPARACSLCACGDPMLAAGDPASISGQLRLQLDTDYLTMSAASETPGATDELTQWSWRLNGVWRPVESLSLMLTVPVVSKVMAMSGDGPTHTVSSFTGLGDVELAARYTVWKSVAFGARRAQELALSAGTSMPTGPYRSRDREGAIDPHAQIGTGSWGPFAGVHYRFEQGDWSAIASVSGRLRTDSSFPDLRYHFGNALLWSVHGQVRALPRLALDLGLDGRHAAADRANDPLAAGGWVAVDDTGGTVLSAAPGVYVNAVGGLWLFLRGQVPVYSRLYGDQKVGATVTSGLQYLVF